MDRAEFMDWRAFYAIEPFGHVRGDVQAAQISHSVASVAAGFSGRTPGPLSDYILRWDEPEKKRKTVGAAWQAARNSFRKWGRKRGN